MPAEWTGDFVGKVHLAGVTLKAVAAEAHLHEKYVIHVLHDDKPSEKAKQKLYDALERLKQQKV